MHFQLDFDGFAHLFDTKFYWNMCDDDPDNIRRLHTNNIKSNHQCVVLRPLQLLGDSIQLPVLWFPFGIDDLFCCILHPHPIPPPLSQNQKCWNNKLDWVSGPVWWAVFCCDALPSTVDKAFWSKMLCWIWKLVPLMIFSGKEKRELRQWSRDKEARWQSSDRSECNTCQNKMFFTK